MVSAGAPDLAQRSALLSELLGGRLQNGEQSLQTAALKTAGFLPAELSALAADAAARAVSTLANAAAVKDDCWRIEEEETPSDGGTGIAYASEDFAFKCRSYPHSMSIMSSQFSRHLTTLLSILVNLMLT